MRKKLHATLHTLMMWIAASAMGLIIFFLWQVM